MTRSKNVLTTGDVARICNVAPRTVSKWFDSGQLRGYRIPGSKDRRIPVNELLRFMKTHNMPTPVLAPGKTRVLLVDSDRRNAEELARLLTKTTEYDVAVAASDFEVGVETHRFSPHVLLVNLLAKEISASEICAHIRADEDLQAVKLIALAGRLSPAEGKALLEKGFDDYVCDPGDVGAIVEKIERSTAIVY